MPALYAVMSDVVDEVSLLGVGVCRGPHAPFGAAFRRCVDAQ
jgi:hypothetical protein